MNCWHCKRELVWGGDFTFEEYGLEGLPDLSYLC